MPAARSRIRPAIRRPKRKRASSTKRRSRKRTTTSKRIPRSLKPTNFFINKYLVGPGIANGASGQGFNCSINGSSPLITTTIVQNTNVNVYALWFTIGDINNSAYNRLTAEWQDIKLMKVVFNMIPRVNMAFLGSSLPNQYFFTAYNKTGFIPTNLLQVEQMKGIKKHMGHRGGGVMTKITRTIFPYIQAPMNDFLGASGIDKPQRSPWMCLFSGVTSNSVNIAALSHTGMIAGMPAQSSSGTGQTFDLEAEYWVAFKNRTGNI